jgi:hypothetical protein
MFLLNPSRPTSALPHADPGNSHVRALKGTHLNVQIAIGRMMAAAYAPVISSMKRGSAVPASPRAKLSSK